MQLRDLKARIERLEGLAKRLAGKWSYTAGLRASFCSESMSSSDLFLDSCRFCSPPFDQ